MAYVWTTPPTFAASTPLSASLLNQLIGLNGNLDLLYNRIAGQLAYQNGANYTTTSTTPVDIDSTHITQTVTLLGTRALVIATAMLNCANVASQIAYIQNYNLALNAVGGTWGFVGPNQTNMVTAIAVFTGLTPGSQTFRVRFAVTNGATTATVKALEGVNGWYAVTQTVYDI